jgi:hypothetical protein
LKAPAERPDRTHRRNFVCVGLSSNRYTQRAAPRAYPTVFGISTTFGFTSLQPSDGAELGRRAARTSTRKSAQSSAVSLSVTHFSHTAQSSHVGPLGFVCASKGTGFWGAGGHTRRNAGYTRRCCRSASLERSVLRSAHAHTITPPRTLLAAFLGQSISLSSQRLTRRERALARSQPRYRRPQ